MPGPKPPFPTPRERSQAEREVLEPYAARVRKLVEAAFSAGRNSSGTYSLRKPYGPDALPQGAYDIVKTELEESDWVVESSSGHMASYWFISEKIS